MRPVSKAIMLLTAALLNIGAAPAPELAQATGKIDILARRGRNGPLIDLNEVRLAMFGGYDGERLRRTELRPLRHLDGMRLYVRAPSGNLYVDRDGDGQPDACAFYNRQTGVLSADWNCDGRGDQLLVDLTPPPPIRSAEDLARRLGGRDPN